MKKRIVIIGGYDKARSLSTSLLQKGYAVTVINNDHAHCEALAEIPRLAVYHGDGTEPFVLQDASIQRADIAIALTRSDAVNLVACELCKQKFGVKRTVALIGDPAKTEFFRLMGIDSVVCEITTITGIIEQQAFLDEIATLLPVGSGQVTISQLPIPADAPAANKRVMDLRLPKNVLIGCIMRGEKGIIPRGDSVIKVDDTLVLISLDEHEKAAHRVLLGR